ASRARIDDLNVYPVPDGDTGTNLTLTVRAIGEALAEDGPDDRAGLAHEVSRAALMGARGNSGVILSQIVRGACDALAESDDLDAEELESELERLGDSLLVVGDRTALKVHVHTDDPGRALSLGVARGVVEGVEIANMHAQTEQREERLLHVVPTESQDTCAVVAVSAGNGNRELYESFGAVVVDGGTTMNPSTADILAAIDAAPAGAVV